MSSELSFKGSFQYGDAAVLETAFAAATELADSDPDFPSPFESGEIERDGLVVRIDIDTSCPSDWFYSYGAIIEKLAEHATSGSVSTKLDDELDTIQAGLES